MASKRNTCTLILCLIYRYGKATELSTRVDQEAPSRKLRILLVLLYYHPHPTGLTYNVQMVAEALAKRGHHVTVLCARHTRDTPRGISMLNGVRVIRLWAPIRISRGMLMPTFPWQLYRLMRQHDVVNIHIPMLEAGLAASLARLAGVKLVATHHADLILPEGIVNNFITKVMFSIFKYMAKRVPCIICYSEDNADHSFYLQPFREKVKAIYPPVIIPEPEPARVRELRSTWRCDGGPLVAFCGRFAQEKRPDLVIRSLNVINERYPNARVVFAGEYQIPYENTWQQQRDLVAQFDSQLIFLGLLKDRQELANFYAACDVLAVPSDMEVFGLVQGESMLCGTPVVASNIFGGRVPVRVTGMGKFCEPGDWRSLGESLLDVIEDRASYVKPRKHISDIFSLESTVDKYERIFHSYARR